MSAALQLVTPPQSQHNALATTAEATMRAYFESRGHRPSEGHWEALRDVLTTLEAMANGGCEQRVFLSALDPGVGKTTAVVHFATALILSPSHADVGMVVCVGRIAEAEALARQLEGHFGSVAVLVNPADTERVYASLPGLCVDPTMAQVLITTQQGIALKATNMASDTSKSSFESIPCLMFKGAVRVCRVWDEEYLPGVTVTLIAEDLATLLKPATRLPRALSDALWAFTNTLRSAETNSQIAVPDWEALYGITVWEMMGCITGPNDKFRDDQEHTAQALFAMGGRTARVWRDNQRGGTLLTFKNTLPADLAPLLVLDASGSVRATYGFMEQHRGLARLRAARKDYGPLNVNVWGRAGSKTAWRSNDAEEMAEGIAKTILTKPDESWLLVVHKAEGTRLRDVGKAVSKKLGKGVAARVRTITWGQHMATNEYADCENIVLAGTLFMKPAFYVALSHLAQDRPVEPGFVNPEDVTRTERGEHAHHILQAICRGRVRRSDGVRCQPMSAYVIAAAQSGIEDLMPSVFPGCVVKAWHPVAKAMRGKVKMAADYVLKLRDEGVASVRYADVSAHVGLDCRNFPAKVSKKPEWLMFLAEIGLVPRKGKSGAWELRFT